MQSLPRLVDRYELLSILGSGGFATVYRARHIHTHQPVAVKLLENRSGVERWLQEARAAAAVQHRNVVRVLDCGRSGDDVFIVMELVEGPTLADAIAQGGPLEPARAIGIAVQLLDGLAVAHARAIVHRDVKPPNVLLTRDVDGSDLPKILDFGVSKQLTEISSTLDGTAIGTPGYMAPELFGGAKNADARADIYAVSVTLYEMLSGKLPFAAQTYEDLVVQVATKRPAPLLEVAPHVPAAIAAAVDRGLARDREARWQTAEQFASALRGALLGIAPPSSNQFEATMNANAANAATAPGVPSLSFREPSTLRTAPPPVVSTANRVEGRSRGILSWVIAVVGVMILLGGGASIVAWRFMHANASSAIASSTVATNATPIVTSPPREGDTSLVAPTSSAPLPASGGTAPTTTSMATSTATATTRPATTGGIHFKFPPKVVGQAHAIAIDALAQRIVPLAQRCRPPHGAPPIVARVQLFVQKEGTISIAQPTGEPGDEATAACLAVFFKETADPTTFNPGGGGIATVEATLDPR